MNKWPAWALICCVPIAATPPTLATRTAGLVKHDGFLPLYLDADLGKAYLEVHLDQPFIHQTTLASGLGSALVGLDRGQLGETRLVTFERRGAKVLLVQQNTAFVANGSSLEQRSVAGSFARSVLWSFPVEATEGDRVLIEATPFLLSDVHGVADQLTQGKQTNLSLDGARSFLVHDLLKAFPRNTEAEAELTFRAAAPGPELRQVAPEPTALSLRVRHSFVALPEPGYKARRFDPRVNALPLEQADYASPFTGPLAQRWVLRHRLEKKDPGAMRSDPVKPIVYYLDPATPEPMRSALLEGASWWEGAFEAAGFTHAFQVKLLPEDADPMDLRYNVIHWIHRASRGWSMGLTVADPRTGEILKGSVLLGSLRVRQDHLLAAGLVSPWSEGPERWAGADAAQLALDRLKQLAAHEVGHTLGFAHNFAASTQDRASVMDYPPPRIGITSEGRLDFRDAYAKGIGAFDRWATTYVYAQVQSGQGEENLLAEVLEAGKGFRFIQDQDGRGIGTAHPAASAWDDGDDPVAQLRHEMRVRSIGLDHFGPTSQPEGEPRSQLQARLLPLYLHHRYQAEAAAKLVGGIDFTYAVRQGKGSAPGLPRTLVPPERQRAALAALADCLEPGFLAVPSRLLDLIPPPAYGDWGVIQERFESRLGGAFDPLAAAGSAADVVLAALLHPDRAARLVQQHAESPGQLGLGEVLDTLQHRTFPARSAKDPWLAAVGREVQRTLVTRLRLLAETAPMGEVRAEAQGAARRLMDILMPPTSMREEANHRRFLRDELSRMLAPVATAPARIPPPAALPGAPIGG